MRKTPLLAQTLETSEILLSSDSQQMPENRAHSTDNGDGKSYIATDNKTSRIDITD